MKTLLRHHEVGGSTMFEDLIPMMMPWLIKLGMAAGIYIGARIVIYIFNRMIFNMDKYAEARGVKKLDLTEHTMKMLQNVVKYLVYFAAVMSILYVFGLDEAVYAFITSAGIVGLAIGFASKDMVANLISGVLVSFDKPFKVGDDVEIGKLNGKVKEITLRSTRIESFDGKVITIPNSKLATEPIVNYSRSKLRRLELDFEVEVGTDIKRLKKIVESLFKKIDWISDRKEPDVIITSVSRLGVSLQIRVWTKNKMLSAKKTELFEMVEDTFRKKDIKIKR
jgi:small conductance mechanosensitive channel